MDVAQCSVEEREGVLRFFGVTVLSSKVQDDSPPANPSVQIAMASGAISTGPGDDVENAIALGGVPELIDEEIDEVSLCRRVNLAILFSSFPPLQTIAGLLVASEVQNPEGSSSTLRDQSTALVPPLHQSTAAAAMGSSSQNRGRSRESE